MNITIELGADIRGLFNNRASLDRNYVKTTITKNKKTIQTNTS